MERSALSTIAAYRPSKTQYHFCVWNKGDLVILLRMEQSGLTLMRMKQSGHSIIVAYEKKRLSTITTYGTK